MTPEPDTNEPTHTRLTPINSTSVRKIALNYSQQLRNGKFKRVSKEFLDVVENHTRAFIRDRVYRHPGVGKTLF